MLRQYELVEKVRGYDPDADEAMLNRAYVFSMKAHGSQTRASGDPYYSHPIEVEAPPGISFAAETPQKLKVSGTDKELVGEIAAKIRGLRNPDPYKHKGVKYAEERLRKKAGKAGKVGAKAGA